MKRLLKTMIFIIYAGSIYTLNCQEIFTVKTTEEYQIHLPANIGEYKHFDTCITWVLNLENHKITYVLGAKKREFRFINLELNPNSTNEKKIYNFKAIDESLTLISNKGNYVKIKLYSKKVLGSNPEAFEKIKVFTNYTVSDYVGLLKE